MTWCLAESAPKTGEHILVCNLGRKDFGTCGGKQQDFATVVHWWEREGEEGFYLSAGYRHSESAETPIHFTHWLPLDVVAGEMQRAALTPPAPPPERVRELREDLRVAMTEMNGGYHYVGQHWEDAIATLDELCALASQAAPRPSAPSETPADAEYKSWNVPVECSHCGTLFRANVEIPAASPASVSPEVTPEVNAGFSIENVLAWLANYSESDWVRFGGVRVCTVAALQAALRSSLSAPRAQEGK